ncbi:50S ribosomal protein L15 [Cellulomonas xiejunii]|uniref:Large ribosomal subunit protein uL15 n=1 Tax=Cellulomonas xiejunii TaxID=2968083 RepID=A0ABY5KM08_9CELL|nr:50S ribosomal protein L15 [Cellulomonas xiejunii]MCC2312652.1 50S ribosomal protein L15 [Cellulomonas xiejunii]MCC2320478.1 50S ribosomal protein L15 [Cellulomonas xiejunii]UUI70773.1 50S ribosomal protein L15 [Cellulomonas xiejunii]
MADDKKADKKAADTTETEAPKAAKKAPAKKAAAKTESAPAAEKKASTKAASSTKAESSAKAEKAPAKKAPTAAAKAAAEAAAQPGAGGTLKVHHLRPAPGAKTAKTRVGRGEASKGKTAGRGTKGTKARYQVPDRFEGGQMPLHMRLPKLRGFKNPFRVEYQVVNLDKLSALYPDGGDVTVADLVAKGAVRKGQRVKVLGDGELTVKVSVDVDAYSATAKDKIEAAGGSVAQG